jgi:hypothetical protein
LFIWQCCPAEIAPNDRYGVAGIPVDNPSLCNFGISVSTGAFCKDVVKFVVLLRLGENSANPDNLLEALLLANLKDNLLGVTKLGVPASRRRAQPVPAVTLRPCVLRS